MSSIRLLLVILLGASSVWAEEGDARLGDFVLPVPANFSNSAVAAMQVSGKNLAHYLKAQGALIVRLPHQETLHLIQIVNAFMGENAEQYSKDVFGNGEPSDSPECRCFGPLSK